MHAADEFAAVRLPVNAVKSPPSIRGLCGYGRCAAAAKAARVENRADPLGAEAYSADEPK